MELNKDKIGVLTPGGEFVYVKNSNPSPSIGEIYESEEFIKKSSIYKSTKKLSIIAASLLIIFLCTAFFRFYNTSAYAVTIDINPSIKLEANIWNKIIKITALNDDGINVLNNLKLKNKNLEQGIQLILNEAQSENYINDNYRSGTKSINLSFKGDTAKLNLSNIENELKNLKVNYNIETSKGNKTNSKKHKTLNGDIKNNNSNDINSKDINSKNKTNKGVNNSKIENNNSNKKTNNSFNENKSNSPTKKIQNDTNSRGKNNSNNGNKNLTNRKNNKIPLKNTKPNPSQNKNENKNNTKKIIKKLKTLKR